MKRDVHTIRTGITLRIIILIVSLVLLPTLIRASEHVKCDFGVVVHTLRQGDYVIFGCSYGTEPREIRPGWWRAAGIAFHRLERGEDPSRRVLIKDSSEAEPDLEYSVGADRISFLLYTYDPREPDHVPFAKESYRLSDPELKPDVEILLKAPSHNQERVNELFRILALPREQAVAVLDDPSWIGSRITQILYELRNYGIRDPKGMLQRLESIGNPWWRDGHAAESLSDIKADLKLVELSRETFVSEAPRFEDYPVKRVTDEKIKVVKLRSHPKATRFRTRLKEAEGKAANFAGHYVVVTWGCGTSCQAVALVDVRSGNVYFAPFSTALGAEFRVDSYLFIDSPPRAVYEYYDGDLNVSYRLMYSYYYLWDEKARNFRLIHTDAPDVSSN